MPLCEDIGQVGLEPVRVLVFVHQHMQDLLLQVLANRILRPQELKRIDEEIVEVHRVQLAFACRVLGGDLRDLLRLNAGGLRLPARGNEVDGLRLVHCLGDYLGDELLLREVLRVCDRRLYNVAEKLLLVVLVEDAERA